MEHLRKLRNRILPVLLLDGDKLVKTVQFKKPNYIGDPVNAVKIFNDKEVDEIILLDISATQKGKEPNYEKIEEICSEAFMPFAYGGGIKTTDQIDKLFKLGIEKIVLNSILNEDLNLVKNASQKFGSQSIVASIDVKKNIFGKYQAYTHSGKKKVKKDLLIYIKEILDAGAGELFINSISKDGTYTDYDFDLIKIVTKISDVPVVICGGAKGLDSFKTAIRTGATALAAGSLFVYKGETNGILINYPTREKLEKEVF